MRRLLALLLFAALLVPAAATASEGHDEENPAQTPDALALQALSLILQHRPPHEEAIEKLDEALELDAEGEVDMRALRAAHEALHAEDELAARRFLERAFPGEQGHVVGVTFRPARGVAQAVAALLGALALALAALGLRRNRRHEHPLPTH